MGFEVEVKYQAPDHSELERQLLALGAEPSPEIEQADIYLRHPARDFAQTNEALRIRRVGDRNHITYKGPRRSGPTKTREEIELPFQAGAKSFEQLLRLFENLGFQRVATVRKRRRTFRLRDQGHEFEIALDLAEGLGSFAEVEIYVDSEDGLAAAQQAVVGLSAKLGLTEVEHRSYLRMVLESQAPTSGGDHEA
ncbi:class IV adenylate cyclase [Singulisphaera sp. PoT]|uniref:class IV adenylate cyclase n=1 Tax=Singulisphaera sp. PoT TaxID=3411797 RepID=UPI003BF49889